MIDSSAHTPMVCRYHRLCQGYLDPMQPHQAPLCPDCFVKIDDGYEQVEQEELADHQAEQAGANG